MHEHNCFLTLTYAPEKLPKGASLHYPDVQLFLRRLRKYAKIKIRFYMCGEYGEQFDRPHYHLLLFGYQFPDLRPFNSGKNPTYTSNVLSRLWPHGHSLIGSVTYESAAYTARYILKKITGDLAEEHYQHVDPDTGEVSQRVPEFNRMSLKPGIGSNWLDRYTSDVYPDGMVVTRGNLGRAPRYYDKRYEKLDQEQFEELKFRREQEGRKLFADNTPERLAVKEQVTRARLAQFKRKI